METNSFEWWEDGATGVDVSFGSDDSDFISETAGRVYLQGEFLNHDILEVSVLCEELETPVLGVAFHLTYDPGNLSFLRYDPGEFLERGGDPFYLVMASKDGAGFETGELVFGETLRRGDQYPVEGGEVAHLYFQELSSGVRDGVGSFEFGFENGVVSTLDTVRQDIDGVRFEDLEFGYTEASADESETGFDPTYLGANVARGFNEQFFGEWVIWFVIVCGMLFSAAFWYFFKRKKVPEIANFIDGR